jgi:hypothetical protein
MKSCVAMACSPLVPKGQVPCGAISVFLVFPDFGLLFSLFWTLPDGCKHLIPRT